MHQELEDPDTDLDDAEDVPPAPPPLEVFLEGRSYDLTRFFWFARGDPSLDDHARTVDRHGDAIRLRSQQRLPGVGVAGILQPHPIARLQKQAGR